MSGENGFTIWIKKIGGIRFLLMLFAAAVLLVSFLPLPVKNGELPDEEKEEPIYLETYETIQERRLKAMLEEVSGISSAEVMITCMEGETKLIEKDKKEQNRQEAEGAGSVISEETTVMIQAKDGSRTPYVLQENPPKVEGVLILLAGDINAALIQEINEAVQALFAVDAHKIKVLKKQETTGGKSSETDYKT